MSWRYLKIEDFCSTGSGGTPSRSKPEYYEGGDIPWIKSGDLKDSTIYDANEYITAAGLENSSAKIVEKDSILIAMYGATVGRLAILGINAATNQAICNIRPDTKIADMKYLYYFLKSKFSYFVENAVGGAQPNISQGLIKSLEVPLPSLSEQKRIAEILDKAAGVRQKRDKAIKLADDFLQTMFQKTFNSQSFLLNSWELKELKDIALIQTGPFGTQLHKEDYVENGIPLINPTNIKNGVIIPNFNLCVDRQKYNKLKEYHLKKGDIIMGRRGEMGRCALINDKENGWFCGTGSLFIRLNTPNEIFSFYLNEYLSSDSIKNFLQKESRGVTMANLNKDIVGKIKINIPPANVLTSFMKIKLKVDSIKEKINHSDLEELLSSLSKKHFQIQNPL